MAGVLAVFSAVTASNAAAQEAPSAALQTLVQTAPYQANISRLFAAMPSDVFRRCPSLISTGSTVTVVQPVSFAADGNPIAGTWKQSFPVSGCGNDTTINFFFTAQPDEKVVSTTAVPGETHADLALQRDAAHYVFIEVAAKRPGCPIHVLTTEFGGRSASAAGTVAAGGRSTAAWREAWTASACDQRFTVSLTFTPDATGTRIVAAPAEPSGG